MSCDFYLKINDLYLADDSSIQYVNSFRNRLILALRRHYFVPLFKTNCYVRKTIHGISDHCSISSVGAGKAGRGYNAGIHQLPAAGCGYREP